MANVPLKAPMTTDPKLLAKLTIQKVFNRYQAAARAITEDEAPEDLTDPDVMAGLLNDYSDGAITNIAREAVNIAMRSGRAKGIATVSQSINKKLIWRRGSVLEDSTCEPCDAADGSVISGEDADLSAICDGDDLCRCIPYANLND